METAGEGPLKKPGRFRRGVDVVLDFIAGCVSPVIPVLLASGLIAAVLSICVNFFGMDVGSGTAVVLSAVKDAGFYFLPIFLGFSTGNKLGINGYLGALLGGVLVYSTINGAQGLSFLGMSIYPTTYNSTVIPVILGVLFEAVVYKLLNKALPGTVKPFLLPLLSVLVAVPVTLQGRSGTYLYGLCGEGSLILAGLVDYLCAQQKLRGAGFTVAVPISPEQAALLQDKGFAWAFALRCLPREVERNLWSQAEFDSVTAKKLCELRERFWPDTVQLTPERMAVVLGDLYSSGATIVSSAHGYGIYFRKEDTLYFVELQADNDRAAEVLMEAAREKEVIVEKAVITVGASQPLFLGEGTRQDYGMIRFDAEPFDVAESYMRLMLEN